MSYNLNAECLALKQQVGNMFYRMLQLGLHVAQPPVHATICSQIRIGIFI
jgi:hypothetical protein